MLDFENEVYLPVSKLESSGIIQPPKTTPPENVTSTSLITPVMLSEPEDPELREKVLKTVHDENFTVYCAVLDAKIYVKGNDLVFDMLHRYCFEVMRVERYSAELAGMFTEYDNVIVRFGLSEHICRKDIPAVTETPQKTTRSRKTDTIPAEIQPPVTEIEPEDSVDTSEIPSTKSTPSVFGDLLRNLRSMGFSPELILLKHNESDESNSEADETPEDLSPEDDDE